MCLTQSCVLTLKSQCGVTVFRTNSGGPSACSASCQYMLHQNTSPVSLERHPELFHPLQSSAWAWGSPGAGRGTEAKWVKVEHLSPGMIYLMPLLLHLHYSSSPLVISNNSRLRASEGQRGHDLASPCPETDGLLPWKGPPQALCSCLTSYSNYHG